MIASADATPRFVGTGLARELHLGADMFEGGQRDDAAARITVVERDAIVPLEAASTGEPHNHAIIVQGPGETHRELLLRIQRRALEFVASGMFVMAITVAVSTGDAAGQATENRAFLVKSLVRLLAPEASRLSVIAHGAGAELRHALLALAGSLTETGSTRASVALDFNPHSRPDPSAIRGVMGVLRRASGVNAVDLTRATG